MNYIKGDIINVNKKNYIIIETLNYNYEKFAFVNELNKNEDIGTDYYIFKIINNSALKITDEKMINKLLEKFKSLINDDLDNIININMG